MRRTLSPGQPRDTAARPESDTCVRSGEVNGVGLPLDGRMGGQSRGSAFYSSSSSNAPLLAIPLGERESPCTPP